MFPAGALEAVSPESINQAVDLFEIIKQLRLRLTTINEETLDRSFETHIQHVLEKLEKRLPLLHDVQAKTVEVVMAKHGLCDATFQQIILLCQHISPALGEILKQLRNIHSEFFSELQFVSNQYLDRINQQQNLQMETEEKLKQLENECQELLATTKILDQEAEENNKLILELRKQLRESLTEINSVKASGKSAAWKSASGSTEHSQSSRPSFDTSVQADVRGRKLFDNMKKSDPHLINHNTSPSPSSDFKPQVSSSSMLSSTFPTSSSSSPSPSSFTPTSSLSSLTQWLLSIRKEIQLAMDSNTIRSMTLNECKDLVSSLFDSRQQLLQKIKQKIETTQHEIDLNGTLTSNPKLSSNLSSLCPDTLEVFVYQTMEKKYGLRSLAVEHSTMLLTAVSKYRQQDITIRLFDYMFRNMIEEEYRGVIDELKKSVKDLLTVGMMNKFPHKDQSTIESMVAEKMTSEEIEESEWTSIVSYLYHSKDATTLRLLLRQEVNRIRQEKGENSFPLSSTTSRSAAPPASSSSVSLTGRSHTPNKRRPSSGSLTNTPHKQKSNTQSPSNQSTGPIFTLPFSVFLACILDFQISNHLKYLEGFHHIFTSCDHDRDGILSLNEFTECFQQLRSNTRSQGEVGGVDNTSEEEEREMFEMIKRLLDPIGTGRISFTVMASCMNQIGKKIMKSSNHMTVTHSRGAPSPHR